jgi:amidase
MPLLEYQDLTIEGKKYCETYSDYWNATEESDGIVPLRISLFTQELMELIAGQIVDAVIMPVAPHAAVIPSKYYHTGNTSKPRRSTGCVHSHLP